MSKKSKKNSKGDTWEWEETPEMREALERLHQNIRELEKKNAPDYGVGNNPTVPLVLSLVACFLFGIGIIIAGYFKGNMHLLTTLKNAVNP